MAQIQKKTSTMSLTISCPREMSPSSTPVLQQQRHSSLVQPLCISPQRTQSPSYSSNYSANSGVAPTFVKCLHDISTVKGQLVVLECRIRGTPPLQVLWYREEEQIMDSADFRILRKRASSASVPEELCTLVITEAYPEDSGMFKCFATNQFGRVFCSASLEVYSDLDEVLTDNKVVAGSAGQEPDDFPSLLRDAAGIPPPEWPDSPEEETAPLINASPESSKRPEKAIVPESGPGSEGQRSPDASTPPPTKEKQAPPSCNQPGDDEGSGGNMADLPTFRPALYPPSAFNYERPRHFIQSQPQFQTPSYESAQALPPATPTSIPSPGPAITFPNGGRPSPSSSTLSSPSSNSTGAVAPPSRNPAPLPAHAPMRSSVTLIPKVAGPHVDKSSPVAFLCSILPEAKPPPRAASPTLSPHEPTPSRGSPSVAGAPLRQAVPQSTFVSLPSAYKGTPSILPKPILKKTAVSRQMLCSTDEEIQGSKDALMQDLEKKLRCKEARRRNNSQKLSYEERMARRLLGPDNAASVFDLENSSDSQPEQPDSPEERRTGGLWGKHHSGTDGNEGSDIQEKCFAPRFLQVPQDLTVEEGRFCRIDFKVGGLPTPDLAWYLDGKAIRPDDYHKMLVCEKGVQSFIIEIVTVHHAGVYECVATNRAGENRFSLRLDVIAQEVLQPPTFVQKMQNSRALEGDTVRLECKVVASPPPQLHWKKDKEMLRIDSSRMSLYQDAAGRQCLLIERLRKSDAGWYTLSAINEAGMSTCNARLDVGTRLNKTAPTGKPSNPRPLLSGLSALSADTTQHTAPLYESEEL